VPAAGAFNGRFAFTVDFLLSKGKNWILFCEILLFLKNISFF
jgi:hypothetical protein